MENEDEEPSKLTSSPIEVEDDSMNVNTATAITAKTTVTDSHEAFQEKTEPQCQPESVAECSESQVPSQEQSLGEGKEMEEAVAEFDESKLSGGGDESHDSKPVLTAVVDEEDGVVANAEDVVNGGDLVVPALVVGDSEGEKEDVISEGERGVADGAEETEGSACVDDVAEGEIVGDQKVDDVAVEAQIESETKVDGIAEATEIVGEQKGDDVAVEAEIENETKVDDVAEETGIVDDVTDEMANMAGDREVAGDTKVVDVAEEKETVDETKALDVPEETETVDESKVVDVAVDTDGRAEMAEDSKIAGETNIVDVAEDREMAKEINVVSAEDTKVADMRERTVAAAADGMVVGDVAEETEMLEKEMEFTDMARGETEEEEEMEKAAEETEMQEVAETEEMEMGDVGEETMEAGADIGDEAEKAETAEEMEMGEDVEEVSKTVGGKRKRVGKNSKSPGKAPPRKKSEEDVCFICFDGGNLVLCDRR